MRIAHLTQSYPPMISGAASVCKRLAEEFALLGHQVLVLTASDRSDGYRIDKGNLSVIRKRSQNNPLRVGQRFTRWSYSSIAENLDRFAPGKPITLQLTHSDGSQEEIITNHTYNNGQIEWFRAGSALNLIRSSR